jgi:hypothetical protein
MNIAVFPARNVKEINAFIDAHDIVQKDNEHRVEIHGDDVFIFYWPELTNEGYEKKLIEARLSMAWLVRNEPKSYYCDQCAGFLLSRYGRVAVRGELDLDTALWRLYTDDLRDL